MVYYNHNKKKRKWVESMQKQEYKQLQEWFLKKGTEYIFIFMNKWRGYSFLADDIVFIFSRAYFDEENFPNQFLGDTKSINILFERIDSKYMELVQEVRSELSKEELKAIILNFDRTRYSNELKMKNSLTIPDNVKKLAYSLLEIKEEDKLLQPYSSDGDFLVDFILNYPKVSISGIELNTNDILISEITASIIGADKGKINIYQSEYLNADLEKIDYNKIFSIPPLGVRPGYLKNILEDKELINLYNENEFRIYDEWLNILKVTTNSKFDKALFIMMSRPLFDERTKTIRKYLLRNGLIEGVIELPEGLFKETRISTYMLLLSNNNNRVKMVNARALSKKDHLLNRIDEKSVETILKAYSEDSEISQTVTLKMIEENDFSLMPRRYTNKELELDNYYYLKDVASIKRGYANLKQSDLNERLSDTETNIKILAARDISDEFDIEDLRSMKNIEEKESVYCVENGDIVFSRGGAYNSLLIRNKGKEKVLVNGTLYIITCDESKINPYYLQMYLASEHCLSQIESLNTGTAISFMSIKQLGELKIPKATKELEEELSQRYKTILDKKEVIRLQKKRLEEETADLISEVL
ncbi:N-6 DNA methylase [Aerococcus tenax]|uniref:N-6 DNA methylase n=1 Tax=Aerococcus tenax TaxID=3078812 RepID=UPI000DCF0C76|nr:N-6 DNA methylase [Aerococcus urinae]RAV70795.1 hypothetical protein DBT40_06230 [Aerococcus urinae]